MKDRIKKIRKEIDLTQQKFADKLGVQRNTIAMYEMGRTAPSDAVIKSICREFNVNEEWLRTGIGEMFIKLSKDEEIAALIGEIHNDTNNSFKRRFVAALAKLNDNDWDSLEKLIDEIVKQKEQ